jgi:hypothetical protein
MAGPAGTPDLVERALRYLLEKLRADSGPADRERLLDEAGMRFNLSPYEAQALRRIFCERTKE